MINLEEVVKIKNTVVVRQPVIKETLDMNNNTIIHVTDPLESQDVSTKAYVDDIHTKTVLLDGSQWMKGTLIVSRIEGLKDNPEDDSSAVCKGYVKDKSIILRCSCYHEDDSSAVCKGYVKRQITVCKGYVKRQITVCKGYVKRQITVCKGYVKRQITVCKGYVKRQITVCKGYVKRQINHLEMFMLSRKPMITIWAERRGHFRQNAYEWSFAPLEMCAVGGLVRRGARSYVWRVTTVPVCLL